MVTEDELAEKIRAVGQLYDESRKVQKELHQVLNTYQLLRDIPDSVDPGKKITQINPQTLERFTEAERDKIKTALDKKLEIIKTKVDKLKEEVVPDARW